MNKGMLRIEGESVAKEEEKQAGNKQQEDVYVAASTGTGREVEVQQVGECQLQVWWETLHVGVHHVRQERAVAGKRGPIADSSCRL